METIDARVSTGLTDAEVIELWLLRQPSPHTQSCYQRDINRLLKWTGKPLAETSAVDLARFAKSLADTGLAPLSWGRTVAAVRSLFGFAQQIGYCLNTATALDLPRTESRLAERIVAEDDVQRMIEREPNRRNRVLLSLLYVTGLRVSEACGLRWRNVQRRGEAGQVTVFGKGRRTRSVLLPAGVWAEVAALRGTAAHDAPVFASRSGKHLDRSRVLRIVRSAKERAEIAANVTTHWLRHAHASHGLANRAVGGLRDHLSQPAGIYTYRHSVAFRHGAGPMHLYAHGLAGDGWRVALPARRWRHHRHRHRRTFRCFGTDHEKKAARKAHAGDH